VFPEQVVYASEGLVGFPGSLAQVLDKRFKLLAYPVQVLNRGFYLRAVFFDQTARVRKGGGKIRPVLRVQQVIDAVDSDFQVSSSVIQGLHELLGLRRDVIDLRGECVEINIGVRWQ